MGTGRWTVWAAAWMLVGAIAPGLAWGDAADALPKGKWLLMADCASRNEAIGIARMYQRGDPDRDFGIQQGALASPSVPTTPDINQPRVVSTDRGRFEVVFGPFSDADVSAGPPAGISLTGRNKGTVSDGDGFVATVWQVRRHVLAAASFKGREAGTLQSGDLTVSIRTVQVPGSVPTDSRAYPRIEIGVRERDGTVLNQTFDLPTEATPRNDDLVAYLVWLDRSAVRPQIVVQRKALLGFVNTLILTERLAGRLQAVGAPVYADRGYEFDDLLDDGSAQIVGRDLALFVAMEMNSNLGDARVANPSSLSVQQWMGYARATAWRLDDEDWRVVLPPVIYGLNGTSLQQLGGSLTVRDRIVQDLAGAEYTMRNTPGLSGWAINRFLIGWMVRKLWLGEWHDGWSRMLRLYDPWYDGVARTESAGEPSFPEKLHTFLSNLKYGPPADLPMSGPTTAANADRSGPLGDETLALLQPRRFPASAARPQNSAATLVAPHRFLTFGHLVDGCGPIALEVQTGIGPPAVLPAKIVARDRSLDLVLLGFDDDSSVFALTGPIFAPDPPERTPVVGYGPGAGDPEAAINFAVGRVTPGLAGGHRQFRAFDAPNLMASAGGPLLDDRGRLVGLADGGFDPNWPGGDLHQGNLALRGTLIRQFLTGAGVPYAFDLHAPKLSRETVQQRAVHVTARIDCRN